MLSISIESKRILIEKEIILIENSSGSSSSPVLPAPPALPALQLFQAWVSRNFAIRFRQIFQFDPNFATHFRQIFQFDPNFAKPEGGSPPP